MEKISSLSTLQKDEKTSTNELKKEEKQHLVDSIVARGEMRLLEGDHSGMELFETAAKLDPTNPSLFFRQGLALYEYGSNEGKGKNLFLGNKKFKMAASLNQNDPTIWHAWGNSLFTLGTIYEEERYFLEAREKYTKALKLDEKASQLHWDMGCVLAKIGDFSGEAIDLKLALNAFQRSYELNTHLPAEFWVNYGNTHTAFAEHINDIRHFVKGINCHRHAISLEPANEEAWISLATTLKSLYSYTHDEDHFSQASDCFAAAAELQPHNGNLFFVWARFLLEGGKQTENLKRLQLCIEKCATAFSCAVENPLITGIWTEALATIGLLTDRLDLIMQAENKIASSLEHTPDYPELYHAHGTCLHNLGIYFNDADYYYQAIEKFQEGLSIDRTQERLWHAIAVSYSAVAQIEYEPEVFEKAYRFFSKALNLRITTYCIVDFAIALSKYGELTNNQKWVEEAIFRFEQALALQKNAVYLHPNWLFHYAVTLDLLGDFYDSDTYYLRAIEILIHVLMIDPDYPHIHHRLALAFSHFGELASQIDLFHKALHHYRLASKRDEENDSVLLDWGLCLINLAEHMYDREAANCVYRDAEHKIIKAAKLGNISAYYHLSCLQAILGQCEKAMHFLEKADDFDALPPLEEILEDEWLDNLKHLSEFRAFIAQIEKRPHHSVPEE